MSVRTISEEYFEKLCANKHIGCERIPETTTKSADYKVSLGSTSVITEIKQLDLNDEDKKLSKVWGTPSSPNAVAPSNRVQGLLADGYSQIKKSSNGMLPTMIVVYNNAGEWNWIDTFTIVKAMFGSYGVVIGLRPEQKIVEIGRGFLGQRKVTKDSFRSLSVVGVLKASGSNHLELICYHNPFAKTKVNPNLLNKLAGSQYIHLNPHERGFIPWEPNKIET